MLGIDALSNDVFVFILYISEASEQLRSNKEIAKKRQNEHDLRLLHHLTNVYNNLTASCRSTFSLVVFKSCTNCDQNGTKNVWQTDRIEK